jgi:hypothetical protein
MAIETNISLIFWNTISGILTSLPTFILIILGVKYIGKKLDDLIKNIPSYIESYNKIKMSHYMIEKALDRKMAR